MENFQITPLNLALKQNTIELGEAPYNWDTQTRIYNNKEMVLNSSTFLGDTGTNTVSGKFVPSKDDPDTD